MLPKDVKNQETHSMSHRSLSLVHPPLISQEYKNKTSTKKLKQKQTKKDKKKKKK